MKEYENEGASINISIRNLVSWLKVGERATHYLHSYPAKLLPHIAHFFLASGLFASARDVILDPFSGSGTVALETILSGRTALYAEVNPVGRLIASVKTRRLDDITIEDTIPRLRRNFMALRSSTKPDVVNIDLWFNGSTIRALARLSAAIDLVEDFEVRDFLRVTFSSVARKVSNADPRFAVPVRRCEQRLPFSSSEVWSLFEYQVQVNRVRLRSLSTLGPIGSAFFVGSDARKLMTACGREPLPSASVAMILTSPPYAGAQKYVRATSLSLGWLGFIASTELRSLEDATIGREHFVKSSVLQRSKTGLLGADEFIDEVSVTNPLRAKIAATYLAEMRSALTESVRVLKPGGFFVLVGGDNMVCGRPFETSNFLRLILEQLGLRTILMLVDPIRSRGLITRRAATANVIANETIIVFEKPRFTL